MTRAVHAAAAAAALLLYMTSNCLATELPPVSVRLYGANTDAGRVEVKPKDGSSSWGVVCSEGWTIAEANAVCRHLGFSKAVAAGTWHGEHGLGYYGKNGRCTGEGDEGVQCAIGAAWPPPEGGHVCSGGGAASVACISSHSAFPEVTGRLSKAVQNIADQFPTGGAAAECPAECVWPMKGVPVPALDRESLAAAYVYPDLVAEDMRKVVEALRAALCGNATLAEEVKFLAEASGLKADEVGISFDRAAATGHLPNHYLLDQEKAILDRLAAISPLYSAYLTTNAHSPLQWGLDEPWRQVRSGEKAEGAQRTLHEDGIVQVGSWGFTEEEMEEMREVAARETSKEAAEDPKNTTSVVSGGAVITARVKLAPIERLLRNETLVALVESYLGDDVTVAGYKVTKLSANLVSKEQYIASKWHHDRVGRRLKMFIFLHDIDCEEGRPTQVALGTHDIQYYRTESFAHSRFNEAWVQERFPVKKACGKAGGGFLFDTHTVHKGTETGANERTTVIVEFHNSAKCPYAVASGTGLPCPSGDSFMLNQKLEYRRFELPEGVGYQDSRGWVVPFQTGMKWRFFPHDVIPPVPPAAYIVAKNETATSIHEMNTQGICFHEGALGVAEFDGELGGGCLVYPDVHPPAGEELPSFLEKAQDLRVENAGSPKVVYGDFYLLLQVSEGKEAAAPAPPSDTKRFRTLVGRYLTPEDLANVEDVTGGKTVEALLQGLEKDPAANEGFMGEVLSTARFVPSPHNEAGLHLVRCLLAERMTDARRAAKGLDKGEDYEFFIKNGYLLKNFDEMEKDNGALLRPILEMAVAGDEVQEDLTFVPRIVTHVSRDTQYQMHVDTFHSVIKMWAYPNNVVLEDGPLHFIPGTHRVTVPRMRWMYDVTKSNHTIFDVAEASLRLWKDPAVYGMPPDMPMSPVPEFNRTLIIADTSGIHHRGNAAPGRQRISWRPIGGQNDGGVRRRDPFREV